MTVGRPKNVVPVLGYHSVSDERRDGTRRWSVSPGQFDEQMALIRDRKCTAMTVSEYAAVLRGLTPLPRRPVLITFDDGFADLADTALPVLRRHGLVATAYVITSRLARPAQPDTGPALDWDQLAHLHAYGVEVGSHSHTHRPLDCLSRAEVRWEVTTSRTVIEDGLRAPVWSFAYPYGYSSPSVRRQVRAAGYTSACGVKNALSHDRDDIFAIARVLIERDTGLAAIDALINGHGWPPAWGGERLRTRGWRAYRRVRHVVSSVRTPTPGSPVRTAAEGTP